ncbi:MAG: LLM class flavin-dependent oxidoreductase, partial [Gaiellales bacterium]
MGRTGTRIGLLFAGAPRVPEMVRLARRAEQAGYESVWMAETRMTRDGFTPLAAIGAATERIRLGTGIVNVYTRGAVVLAVSFATLDEIAPGRTIVGLGPGSPLVLGPQGFEWDRPLRRLREYSEVMRPLLRGEPVDYDGDTIRLEGALIEDVLGGEADPSDGGA